MVYTFAIRRSSLVYICSIAILQIVLTMYCITAEYFDNTGRLFQVEYADKASMRGGTTIGLCSNSYAVLFTWQDNALESSQIKLRKIHRITNSIGVCGSGVVSDVNFLINKLFEDSVQHVYLYGEDPPPIRIVSSLADYVHEKTLSARFRPLGVRILAGSEHTSLHTFNFVYFFIILIVLMFFSIIIFSHQLAMIKCTMPH